MDYAVYELMSNHRVGAEVLRAEPGDAMYISDCINEGLAAPKIHVLDMHGGCSAESNPDRISARKVLNTQSEDVAKFNPGWVFETY